MLWTAAVGCALFVWLERRSSNPMMDLTLFRDTSYALAIATICTVFFAVYGMLLLTTQFLQNVRGYTPSVTGLMILPFSAAVAIVSPLVGHLVGRIGARVPHPGGAVHVDAGSAHAHLQRAPELGPGPGRAGLVRERRRVVPDADHDRRHDRGPRRACGHGVRHHECSAGDRLDDRVRGFGLRPCRLAFGHTRAPSGARGARPGPAPRPCRDHYRQCQSASACGRNRPRRHIEHRDPVAIAEEDFIEGIRVALLVATATLAVVFLAGWRWFPRDVHTAGSDAKREAAYSDDRRVRG